MGTHWSFVAHHLTLASFLTFIDIHHYRWSPYSNSNEDDFQCGAEEADDEELWYTNLAPCYRAQAAYSLYGILKGAEDTGCSKKTFINSFFTSAGFESFTTALAGTGITFQSNSNGDDEEEDDGDYPGGVSSQCEAEKVNDDDGEQNGYGHNQKMNQGYTSYGVTCTSNGDYVQSSFVGASCTQSAANTIMNNLTNLNQDLEQAVCVPIYKPSSSAYDDDQGNNNNNKNGDNDNDPTNLLLYSQSCSVREYPGGACPDPYGKLRSYEHKLEASTGHAHNQRREKAITISSWVLFVLGSLLLVSALTSHTTRAGRKRQRNSASSNSSSALKSKSRGVSVSKRFTNMFQRKS
jgi:hypothetical protein